MQPRRLLPYAFLCTVAVMAFGLACSGTNDDPTADPTLDNSAATTSTPALPDFDDTADAVASSLAASLETREGAVVVMPFTHADRRTGLGSEFADTVSVRLASRAPETVSVLDRDALKAVFREQELGAEDAFDQDQAVEFGRLMSAQFIVLGDFSRLPPDLGDGSRVTVKVIDVETGAMIGMNESQFNTGMPMMASNTRPRPVPNRPRPPRD